MWGDDVDSIPPHALIADLLAVPLGGQRQDVLGARALLEATGSVPYEVVISLRALYKKNSVRIQKVYESRERARISMALEGMATTRDKVEAEAERRKREREAQKDDMGI
jgi:quinol monooxygenase YgiN